MSALLSRSSDDLHADICDEQRGARERRQTEKQTAASPAQTAGGAGGGPRLKHVVLEILAAVAERIARVNHLADLRTKRERNGNASGIVTTGRADAAAGSVRAGC